jgi:tetratricopeptide (TPR) repeat protein
MLHAKLLGHLEFTLNDHPLPLPQGRLLEWLVFVASSATGRHRAELETLFGADWNNLVLPAWCADALEFSDEGVRFIGSSDVGAYRSLEGDLKALARLRGEFAPGLTSGDASVQTWLEAERFAQRKLFLSALLQNGAGLIESGRVAEGEKNLSFVEHERATLPAGFAAELNLELARVHWRLNRPDRAAMELEHALPHLTPERRLEAQVNLSAALLRLGRIEDAVTALRTLSSSGASRGWGLVHRANALRFGDDLESAVRDAGEAFQIASLEEDGYLAVSALNVQGEALLEMAQIAGTVPKDAVIAFGKALGISEVLGEDASAMTLAGLAHAHAVWGNQQKALEQAERAFKRARTAKDSSATVRALLALYAVTRIGSFARNALNEARAMHHKPLELLASLCVLEKDPSTELRRSTREIASRFGSARWLTQLERFEVTGSS